MSPRKKTAETALADQQPTEETPQTENVNDISTEANVIPIASEATEGSGIADPVNSDYALIIERGLADKLSPTSTGKIYYQLAQNINDQKLYLRISGNDGGGLHSKEWIDLAVVIETLSTQANRPFKSTLLKPCMRGKSSNNASFLAAILRAPDIALTKASEKNAFLHLQVDDFETVAEQLLQRSPASTP
ncbi:hypothetical protein [Aliamphritea hakodatensis]|uniref:hypothetical protein n=1 Tax=Aliamphritea hakodatensis TaxID=2895352 RepID=UPI0022FD5B6E|nr:hypothetical protein [Aliamphritea hakodatensis]